MAGVLRDKQTVWGWLGRWEVPSPAGSTVGAQSAHMVSEQPLLGAGGCSPRRDVLDRPRAAALPPHGEAAGADGVRDA